MQVGYNVHCVCVKGLLIIRGMPSCGLSLILKTVTCTHNPFKCVKLCAALVHVQNQESAKFFLLSRKPIGYNVHCVCVKGLLIIRGMPSCGLSLILKTVTCTHNPFKCVKLCAALVHV